MNEQQQLRISKVTAIGTLIQLLNTCTFSKTMMSEVDKLLRIYLTVPVTSATAERSFSTLRRLKNYLRSTMTQKRLNHVVLLHVHKQQTDQLDLSEIASQLISANDRRRVSFGHY